MLGKEISIRELKCLILYVMILELVAFIWRSVKGIIEWKKEGISFGFKLDEE
jgi:hypothetical protein